MAQAHRSTRLFLGFIAGALSVLIFHQITVEALYLLGLAPFSAFRVTPVPPFGVPLVVNLCFWGGLWGALFSQVALRLPMRIWVAGIALGLTAALVGLFIVAPIKGNPIAAGWQVWPIARSLLINGIWGLGVGLIFPVLAPRPLVRPALARA